MSLDEFWRFSAENPELRLEREPNGDVILMSPTLGGADRSSSIFGQLYMWSEKDGSGYALDSSTGCQLPDGSVRGADAAWTSSQRWTPPPVQDDAPVPFPDFVIEFRSKSDRLKPAQSKMLAWISNGVQLAWLVEYGAGARKAFDLAAGLSKCRRATLPCMARVRWAGLCWSWRESGNKVETRPRCGLETYECSVRRKRTSGASPL